MSENLHTPIRNLKYDGSISSIQLLRSQYHDLKAYPASKSVCQVLRPATLAQDLGLSPMESLVEALASPNSEPTILR